MEGHGQGKKGGWGVLDDSDSDSDNDSHPVVQFWVCKRIQSIIDLYFPRSNSVFIPFFSYSIRWPRLDFLPSFVGLSVCLLFDSLCQTLIRFGLGLDSCLTLIILHLFPSPPFSKEINPPPLFFFSRRDGHPSLLILLLVLSRLTFPLFFLRHIFLSFCLLSSCLLIISHIWLSSP